MPEISPELAARIESLRASHAENPARFFMPLASAYREGGDVARAEELLRENLKRHPGYLSAHVLLGRCLADREAFAEARNEFQYVLSVDPQNLIALRSLGDMAAAGGDRDEARRWYGELLAVDPMNAEAKQAMAGLDAAPEPAAEPQSEGESGGFGMVDPDEASSPDADHPAAVADPGTWGELSLDAESAASEPTAADESGPTSFDALDFGAVDIDAQAGEPVDFAPSAEPETFAAPESASVDAWGAVDDGQDELGASSVEPLELEEFYGGASDLSPVAHDEPEDHEEVVTETIAELYARQGFPERAAGVYRELIARRGEEPALVRRLQEMEAQAAAAQPATDAEEAPDWLQTVDAVASGDPPATFAAAPAADLEPIDFAPVQPADEAPDAAEWAVDLAPSGAESFAAELAETFAGEPTEAAAVTASTGDAFADSFAGGFDGAASEPSRAQWEIPSVEETAPVPELEPVAASAEPAQSEAPAEAQASAEVAPAAPEPSRGVTIVSYLSSLLAWRPGASAAPAAPQADAAAPPPAHPWDEETLGAAEQQPPVDEPWIASGPVATDEPAAPAAPEAQAEEPWGAPVEDAPSAVESEDAPWDVSTADETPGDAPWGAPVADEPSAADEPWAAPAAEEAPAPSAGDEPWGAPAAELEPEPWAETPAAEPEPSAPVSDAGQGDAGDEDLPWLSSGTEAPAEAAPSAPAAEPMPWEASFELSSEAPADAGAERAAPRQEPTAEPGGGFSFEDFFSEPAALPEPLPEPEPLPLAEPPAAAPSADLPPAAAAQGGEEDEDLESFQAWLQSLKR